VALAELPPGPHSPCPHLPHGPSAKPTTVSFPLLGEPAAPTAGRGLCCWPRSGTEVELIPGQVQVAVADAHSFSASSLLSTPEPSSGRDPLLPKPAAFASISRDQRGWRGE